MQIELDPKRVSLRYPVEAALVGDSGRVLRMLLPRLEHHQDRSFLEQAQKGMAKWRELMNERGTRMDTPMKPQVVAHELNKLLSELFSQVELSKCDKGETSPYESDTQDGGMLRHARLCNRPEGGLRSVIQFPHRD